MPAWITRSAPCANASKNSGVAHVLSNSTTSPRSRASAANAGTSHSSMLCDAGASRYSARVFGRISAASASTDASGSKYVVSMPARRSTPSHSWRAGLYTASVISRWSPADRHDDSAVVIAASPDGHSTTPAP